VLLLSLGTEVVVSKNQKLREAANVEFVAEKSLSASLRTTMSSTFVKKKTQQEYKIRRGTIFYAHTFIGCENLLIETRSPESKPTKPPT